MMLPGWKVLEGLEGCKRRHAPPVDAFGAQQP
jgi:hypothetical protein